VRTKEVVKKVRERLTRIGDRSVRKMVTELDLSRSSLRTIVKNDLNLKPYKKEKVFDLTKAQKAARVQK
jgi:hypothetical protein